MEKSYTAHYNKNIRTKKCSVFEMEAVGIGDASGYNKADYKIQKFEELLKIAGIE